MPFSYGCRGISCAFEEVGKGELLRFDDHSCITSRYVSARSAKGIFASEEGIARRGAGGG